MAVPTLGTIGPAYGGAAAEPGLLSGHFGVAAAAAGLLAHLAYGGVLGEVYGCRSGGRSRELS